MLPTSSQHDTLPYESILVLTDGSERAKRIAEWELVFSEASEATVHRIDVLDCLDSGVIIRTDDGGGQNEHRQPERSSSRLSPHYPVNRNHGCVSAIDVLHGRPHEAILDYVAANLIDCIVLSTHEQTPPNQSFLEQTFTRIHQEAPVPVINIDERASQYTTQRELAHCAGEHGRPSEQK
ncbi:universal stress protein [Haladaptatus halobius]|uniref:universal stress protein n=1 Tax=Haladaptatus halobius TaxID=2884875 RepID=UPI001D0BCE99